MINNTKQGWLMLALFCTLASVVSAGNSYAATSTGTASATVIKPISVSFVGAFDPATLASSKSASGPLLRFGSNPPAGTVTVIIDSGSDSGSSSDGSNGGSNGDSSDGAPSPPKNAKVVLTKNTDGTVSIRVTGKVGLTFSVTQPDAGTVTVEYN
jgi:hypothetical protein